MLKTTVPEFNLDFNILKTIFELILISILKTVLEYNLDFDAINNLFNSISISILITILEFNLDFNILKTILLKARLAWIPRGSSCGSLRYISTENSHLHYRESKHLNCANWYNWTDVLVFSWSKVSKDSCFKNYDFEMLKWLKSFVFDDAQRLYFALVPSLVQLYLETMQQQHIIVRGHGLTVTMSQNWKVV